jgi:hypothetical protein
MKECPVFSFKAFWKFRPYETNKTPLSDFFLVFLFVDFRDRQTRGTLDRFKYFLDEKYDEYLAEGRANYKPAENEQENERYIVYETYLKRIYAMFRNTGTDDEKLEVLYGSKTIRTDVRDKIRKFKEYLATL